MEGEKNGTAFDSIVKELHCFWRLPDVCACFEVRATRFFPVSMHELMCLEKYRNSVHPILSLVDAQRWMPTIIFLTLIFLEALPLFTVSWNKILLPPCSGYKDSDFHSLWSLVFYQLSPYLQPKRCLNLNIAPGFHLKHYRRDAFESVKSSDPGPMIL